MLLIAAIGLQKFPSKRYLVRKLTHSFPLIRTTKLFVVSIGFGVSFSSVVKPNQKFENHCNTTFHDIDPQSFHIRMSKSYNHISILQHHGSTASESMFYSFTAQMCCQHPQKTRTVSDISTAGLSGQPLLLSSNPACNL